MLFFFLMCLSFMNALLKKKKNTTWVIISGSITFVPNSEYDLPSCWLWIFKLTAKEEVHDTDHELFSFP